jgi:Bacteriocin-protection, YdeI or OmpD-Associated
LVHLHNYRKDNSRSNAIRQYVRVPADFKKALAGNASAAAAFMEFTYSQKKEWVE